MPDALSIDDLLDFLAQMGDRGLMPAATAQSMAVAVRNVASVLDNTERDRFPADDLDTVIGRFNNKRARDFNPASLKEYGRRVKRAVELYLQWRADPANFTVRTRTTNGGRKTAKRGAPPATRRTDRPADDPVDAPATAAVTLSSTPTGYQTAFPVRAGQVVTVANIPHDLSTAEAERLAQFILLLASP